LQTTSLLSLSPVLPALFGNTARAAAAVPDDRVLVVIQLDGGNDGLNTVVPYADDGYGRARDKLRLETSKLQKLNDQVALHPSMRAAKELFDDGRLSIVQGVGYPNPDRSHFRSMAIWQTASFDDAQHRGYGWLGSALDRRVVTQNSGAPANAIFIGEQETPVALWGRRSAATALARADDLKLSLDLTPSQPDAQSENSSLAQFVSSQVLSAYAAADEFQRRQSSVQATASSYPNSSLGTHLKLVSTLLKSGAQSRVYYTIQSGYDTHSTQLYAHARLLEEFSGAIKAFLDDLKANRLDDRVIVLAFSEFGRRVAENDSQGTDHGTAGPVFLVGAPVSGGLVGAPPDLVNLDNGDLKMQFDFRRVYATILDNWLGVNSKDLLGESFDKLDILSV
jgi:uncharacterized protein (DUF1501 family)